jgi:hypothetical protein
MVLLMTGLAFFSLWVRWIERPKRRDVVLPRLRPDAPEAAGDGESRLLIDVEKRFASFYLGRAAT